MKLKIYFILSIFLVAPSYANDLKKLWPNLEEIELEKTHMGNVNVYINPEISEKLMLKEDRGDYGIKYTPFRIKLTKESKQTYLVEYSMGPSGDPSFFIQQETANGLKQVFYSYGLNLIIPGNGSIYITGHTNNYFNTRKKYNLQNGMFIETKQPFYYVGLQSKTNHQVSLYSAINSSEVVASLPIGTPVEIILEDNDWFLVKTPFGLIGWSKIEVQNEKQETQFKDLVFNGD